MKIGRFRDAGKTQYGVREGTQVVEYAGTPYPTFKTAPVVPSKIVAVGL